MLSRRGLLRWGRAGIAGLVVLACGAMVGTAAAGGGHLPGFSVADQRVAAAKLPESLRFTFGGIPGAKGTGLPHVGKGPLWFGEAQRPKGTVYVAGNGRWVCESEVRDGSLGGGSSCTTPAAARELGLLDVSACGKGAPRHFRVVGLAPDGVTAFDIVQAGGKPGRTVPVIGNTVAFTIGRENVVMRATGDATAAGLERRLPLAQSGKGFGGSVGAGCASFTFFESREADEAGPTP